MNTQVAVITGGGRGLGRSFAKHLASVGWTIAVVDINGENAQNVAEEITASGGIARAYQVDVSDRSALQQAAEQIAQDLGPVTALVNNAAIFSSLQMGSFLNIGEQHWRDVIDVNITGTFFSCQIFVPYMKAAGYGKIVNLTSSTVFMGRPNYLHYVTSKSAIVGFTRALAAEVGDEGIRVNAIAPGSVRTEEERTTITQEQREALAKISALKRVQIPSDLDGVLEFLLSPQSDFVTGQTLVVDGGITFH